MAVIYERLLQKGERESQALGKRGFFEVLTDQ